VRLSPNAGLEFDAQSIQHLFFFKCQLALSESEKQAERYIVKFRVREKYFHRLIERLNNWPGLEQLGVEIHSQSRQDKTEFERRVSLLFKWLEGEFPILAIQQQRLSLIVFIVRVRIVCMVDSFRLTG
jgi:hypothetical protein